VSESESKSTSDLPDFIPAHLPHEPFFDRRGTREAPVPAVREGLPPTYRMRADAHYVDQLTGPSPSFTVQVLKVNELESSHDAGAGPPESLVASIGRHTVLQPLIVQQRRERYRVIDGHKRLAAAVAAGLSDVPCVVHDVDDDVAASLADAANALRRERADPAPGVAGAEAVAATIGRELVQSLASITSSVDLLSPGPAGLSHLVAMDLIRTELWRSSCLVDAARVVRGQRPIVMELVQPARILEQAVARMAVEARLRGTHIDLKTIDVPSDAVVRGDEGLLVVALSSMLLMTLVMIENASRPRVTISASSRSAGHVVFDVSQDVMVVSTEWASRAFEATWIDRPGGVPATMWMLGAERVALALGGKVGAVATGLGTMISFTVPLASGQ